jgi:hypothetical protein
MGGVFPKPKSPSLPPIQETEEPQAVVEDETDVKRRQRRKLQTAGRSQNILAGIQMALKKRLGE